MASAVVQRAGRQLAVATEPRSASGLNPSPRSGVVEIPVTLTVFRGDGVGPAGVARAPLRGFEGDAAHAGATLGAVPWAQAEPAARRVAPPAARQAVDFPVPRDQGPSATMAHVRYSISRPGRNRASEMG